MADGVDEGHDMHEGRSSEESAKAHDARDVFLVLIAVRRKARYIHNLDEVIAAVRSELARRKDLSTFHSISILPIYFGDYHPCEQIQLMNRAHIYIFVHGAEGGLVPFVRPGTVVVEIHPAGCCMSDYFPGNPPDFGEL
jgi:hypothetical protein